MKDLLLLLQAGLLFLAQVRAHGGIYNYTIDGVDYAGHYPWAAEEGQQSIQRRWWPDPIYGVRHPYLACNRGNPLATLLPTMHAPVRAGSTVTVGYIAPECPLNAINPTTPSVPGDPPQPMSCHGPTYTWVHAAGPLLAYMAACNGPCDKFQPEGEKVWFKIYETALVPEEERVGMAISSSLAWHQYKMILQDGRWDLTTPRNLKAGNYLLRHEIIMIGSSEPVQMYPHCAQLTVTGGGDRLPPVGSDYLVAFPGAYSEKDTGIAIAKDIYHVAVGHVTYNYTIPGPKLWTGEE
ncbi:Auxiliary Activity family 9 catalytic domain-containing protein [Madurella fahalii]|uniref:lytic cellulose monooxygenase (C4-dehydrogenating) n=1 Tax=Madurella fahalii TaxID=1157608 RepID=A0ABQ0GE91_9PEZI